MIHHRLPSIALATLALLTMQQAHAHAVINEGTAEAGAFAFITLRITHGCGTSPTTQIRMKIPEGVLRVSPKFMAHWSVEKRMKTLDTPYRDEAGNLVNETVDEIVWSGGSLPDGYYGEFQVRALMPDEQGRMLWFKTIQTCEVGAIRWIEVPAREGQSPYDFKEPSPFIRLVEKPHGDEHR